MKIKNVICSIIAVSSLFVSIVDCEAAGRGGGGGGGRGGGGGGGRGGGGGGAAHRGGGGGQAARSYDRTPSMSRSDIRPRETGHAQQQFNRPQGQQNRPSQQQLHQFINQPGQRGQVQSRPSENRQQFQEYAKKNQPRSINTQDLKQRQQQFTTNRTDNGRKFANNERNLRDRLQNTNPNYGNWFNNDFFGNHNYYPYYYHDNMNWWAAARWGTLAGWMDWGWNQPYWYADDGYYPLDGGGAYGDYTDYGDYGNAQQTDLNQGGDWMPLGVFAIGRNENQLTYSQMFLQLAINKDGNIAGTYYNAGTDSTRMIDGMVDKTTQEAVWKLSDDANSPIASTGIYNLTQPQTSFTVEFPGGSQQTWQMLHVSK